MERTKKTTGTGGEFTVFQPFPSEYFASVALLSPAGE